MTRTFDSGQLGPIRELIRSAIIGKLAPLQRSPANAQGYAEVIEIGYALDAHSRDFDLALDMFFQEVQGRSPVIAVAIGGMNSSEAGAAKRNLGDFEVRIYIWDTQRNSPTLGRVKRDVVALVDDRQNPGIDTTLEAVWLLVNQADLGLGPSVFRPRHLRDEQITASLDGLLWQMGFGVTAQRDINPDRGATELLQRMTATVRKLDVNPLLTQRTDL